MAATGSLPESLPTPPNPAGNSVVFDLTPQSRHYRASADGVQTKRGYSMKFKSIALVASTVAFMALGACSESEQEAQEDLVEQQYESAEDVLEEEADLAEAQGAEVQEEVLDAQADAMGEMGDEAEDAVDAAQ
jgi:hypothetical protein